MGLTEIMRKLLARDRVVVSVADGIDLTPELLEMRKDFPGLALEVLKRGGGAGKGPAELFALVVAFVGRRLAEDAFAGKAEASRRHLRALYARTFAHPAAQDKVAAVSLSFDDAMVMYVFEPGLMPADLDARIARIAAGAADHARTAHGLAPEKQPLVLHWDDGPRDWRP